MSRLQVRILLLSVAVQMAFCCSPPAKNGSSEEHGIAAGGSSLMKAAVVTQPCQGRLLILGDGFTAGNGFTTDAVAKTAFDREVANVKKGLALLPGLNANQITTCEKRLDPSESLGLAFDGAAEAQCYFSGEQQALPIIAEKGKPFGATHYIIIVAVDGGVGCADGTTMFINDDTPSTTVAHEMGHALIGLYDERGEDEGDPTSPIEWRNCTDNVSKPQWDAKKFGNPQSGCYGYVKLWRPTFDTCRMTTPSNVAFCGVCDGIIKSVEAATRLALPPGSTSPGVDVTAVIDANGGIRVMDAADAPPDRLRPDVITGETFAVVNAFWDDSVHGAHNKPSGVVGVTPLANDDGTRIVGKASDPSRVLDLRARRYPPYSRGPDVSTPVESRLVHIFLKRIGASDIKNRHLSLELDIRPLADGRRSLIVDDATIAKLQGPAFHAIDLSAAIRLLPAFH